MTDRMKNALAHIQAAEDVDAWAAEVIAYKFVGFDVLLEVMQNTHDNIREDGPRSEGFKKGLELALGLITEVMKGENK